MRIRILVDRKGKTSLPRLSLNLENNLLGESMKGEVRRAWQSVGKSLAAEVAAEMPVRKTPYMQSHPNSYLYGRKPGQLRASVVFRSARRGKTPAHGIPRAYIKVERGPYSFLLRGTRERRIKTGPRAGQSTGKGPDRINERRYQVYALRRALTKAAAKIEGSAVFRHAFESPRGFGRVFGR